MLKKACYSMKVRGGIGTVKLLGSYAHWYLRKYTSQNRRFLKTLALYQMYLNLDDPGLSTTIGRGGERERAHTKVLLEELREGMCVLDIGANLGYYALLEAASVGPHGRVYAVEPMPQNFCILQDNVILNHFEDRIETFPLAMSDRRGSQRLHLSQMSNLNTLFPDSKRSEHCQMTGEAVEVETVDLCSFLEGKRHIDLIRMDIEGAEVEVLGGVVDMVEQKREVPNKILFETHRSTYDQNNRSIERPLRQLFEYGFYVKRLISNSDDGHKWSDLGYTARELIYTDGMVRGIYAGVSHEDAIALISRRGGVRAALLEKQ